MIDSIELKNWKTHGDTRLSFSRGTNILIGQMGAGKSTIMDAISFALFGTYPAIQQRRVAVDEIITSRPEQKNRASVALRFTVDGIIYYVERNLELSGATRATITKNGAYLQSQPQRVNEEIERILRVDYDLFSRAIYSEQNRLSYFLELRPSERKKQIDELLGLDKFALAQENSTTLMNKIKDMASESEKTISTFDIKKLKEQHKSLLEELSGLKQKGKELEEALREHEKKKETLEKKLKEAKEQYGKKIMLAREIGELKSKIEVMDKEIEKIQKRGIADKSTLEKKLSETKKNFESLKEEEKRVEDHEKAAFEILAHLEAEKKSIRKEVVERERLRKEYEGSDKKGTEEAKRKRTEDLKMLNGEREANVASRNENQKWLAELEKHLSKCPICERDLPEEIRKRILEEKAGMIKKLDELIEKQKREIEKMEKEVEQKTKELEAINRIEERLKEYKDSDKRLKEIEEKSVSANEENLKLKKKREEASDAASKTKETLVKLETEKETIERMEGYIADKKKSSDALKEKEQQIGKIDIDEEGVEKMQNEFTQLNVKAKEQTTRLEANSVSAKEKATQAEEKKKDIDAIDKLYDEVKAKKKAIENIARFKTALEETQTSLRTRLIGSINEIMGEVWPELYPYGDYQNILLEPTTGDYVLKVKTLSGKGMGWENVETIASGGEKSVACLAMRVAFALVLVPNLRWIILDEPTHNIDQRGLGKFVKAINEVLPRLVEQVFIITHDEMLKQVVNARIYVLSRNKEENGGTMIEAY